MEHGAGSIEHIAIKKPLEYVKGGFLFGKIKRARRFVDLLARLLFLLD